uniref:Uncharacterized protein n=1 Tax=Trichogramma kaykai TaxID=54128 RepID=A0ABD2WLF7_9HYME
MRWRVLWRGRNKRIHRLTAQRSIYILYTGIYEGSTRESGCSLLFARAAAAVYSGLQKSRLQIPRRAATYPYSIPAAVVVRDKEAGASRRARLVVAAGLIFSY